MRYPLNTRIARLQPDNEPDAAALVLEYMSATLAETGHPTAAAIGELPPVLGRECGNLAEVYRPPGTLLLAYQDADPAACVGVVSGPLAGAAEIKRLYVRPGYRGQGLARQLMDQAHCHASASGFSEVVLDVLPARRVVIEFYRRLGYRECEPFAPGRDSSMVFMRLPLGQVSV